MNFIAHRGYSRRFPENSLAAFQAVIEHARNGHNLIGIELDVQLTADGRIAVLHDTSVPKDTMVAVAAMTFDELQRCHARAAGQAACPVPDILETFDLVEHKTELCIEIKQAGYDMDRFMGALLDALASYRPRGDVVLSSFSADIVERAAEATADIDVRHAFIFEEWKHWDGLPDAVRSILHFAHPHYKLLLDQPERLADTLPPVQCWTVDDPAAIETLMSLPGASRIRAIMTNDINLAETFGET
ncbi:MAG: hypothetical protein GF418_04745 [Chitinivibrionales bacterium]|nr:hypothetical protein [Chitinivibrionales bacterium]MBD3394917.1 hypothetical protein [Chitinivibrionales bacterium]